MNILLACYSFPPNAGIGGRRWAKFAKYLARAGLDVYVIHAEPPSTGRSQWTADVMSDRIHCTALRRRFYAGMPLPQQQVYLLRLFKRVYLKGLTYWYRLTTNRRLEDATLLWRKEFIRTANNLIVRKEIKAIIATGAPFYLLEYCADLKKQFPYIKLICDLRDLWFGSNLYGMSSLKEKELEQEQKVFRKICIYSDYITAPNPVLLDIQSLSGTEIPQKNRYILQHAFDQDDLPSGFVKTADSDSIRVIYGGALYSGCEVVLEGLDVFLSYLMKNNKSLYERIRVDIYTDDSHDRIKVQHKNKVRFFPSISNEIHTELRKSTWVLLLALGHAKDFMTTKFFEYGSSGVPFMVLGEPGVLAEEVVKNDLGVFISHQLLLNSPESVASIFKDIFVPNKNYFLKHSYQDRTQELLCLLSACFSAKKQ
ncbi:MAG: hypothetical protein D3909_10375 [Candidatus Electrothrix sp. ATG1]|nr:hypothetical protein [Candidatus Electrothrix sp. ATG1]